MLLLLQYNWFKKNVQNFANNLLSNLQSTSLPGQVRYLPKQTMFIHKDISIQQYILSIFRK